MEGFGFVAGGLLATLGPAALAVWLVARRRRDWLGAALALVAGLGAAWLGLGVFVRLTLTPFFPEGFD